MHEHTSDFMQQEWVSAVTILFFIAIGYYGWRYYLKKRKQK